MTPKAFAVQLADKRVRVVLKPRGANRTLYAYFSYKGERHHLSTGHVAEREAREQARALVERAASDAGVIVTQSMSRLIEDYIAIRWPHGDDNDSTYTDAKNRLALMSGMELQSLDLASASNAVQKWIDAGIKAKKSPQTIQNERLVLSRFCSYLIRRQLVSWPANPCASNRIEAPRVVRTISKPLANETIMAFLKLCQNHVLYPVLVLLLSGVRPRAALCVIRWADIDFEQAQVRTVEKSRARTLPLSAWAVAELLKRKKKADALVWPRTYKYGFEAMRILAAQIDAPQVTLQALRRAAIRQWWAAGVAPQVAAKLAGHSVATAMRHYADAETLDGRHAADMVDWSNKDIDGRKQQGTKTAPKAKKKQK